MLEEVDAGVEWRVRRLRWRWEGKRRVFRGTGAYPMGFETFTISFAELLIQILEIQPVGDRVVGIGRILTRGKAAEPSPSLPFGVVMEFKTKANRTSRSYLDPRENSKLLGSGEEPDERQLLACFLKPRLRRVASSASSSRLLVPLPSSRSGSARRGLFTRREDQRVEDPQRAALEGVRRQLAPLPGPSFAPDGSNSSGSPSASGSRGDVGVHPKDGQREH